MIFPNSLNFELGEICGKEDETHVHFSFFKWALLLNEKRVKSRSRKKRLCTTISTNIDHAVSGKD
jgi:hypothetical protein